MNSRERILTALAHREPDRVPIGFEAHEGVQKRLMQHYGVDSRKALFAKMGIDGFSIFMESYVYPQYIGPEPTVLADGTKCDFFGIDYHQRHLPLAFAQTASDLDRYRWPSADWFRYDGVAERCRQIKADGWVTAGGEGGCGIQHAINLRGYANALMDPLADPELCQAYMTRMGDFFVEWNERWLGAAGGGFELFRCGDEIGSNTVMHLSPTQWREFHKPQLARIFAVAKRHGLIIWFHCCGCCRPVLDDLIEIGIDLWDPVPGYVTGNDQAQLKQRYGNRLSFVGGVDQPNILVKGTPQQVRDEVKRCLDIFAPGGGYILGPSQCLTDDVPLANAVAMYEAAVELGEY